MPKLRQYYSMSQNFDTFNTPHDALFLVFGVSNAKYLAFGTPDGDALNSIKKKTIGPINNSKNKLNSEIILIFHSYPNARIMEFSKQLKD